MSSSGDRKSTLWSKGRSVPDWVHSFTVGDDWVWDNHLLPYDIDATIVHAEALVRAGILDTSEASQIELCLRELQTACVSGKVSVTKEDEDSHTVIEHWLVSQLGSLGERIHSGRSRNDQVLTSLRMFLRDCLGEIASLGADLSDRLCALAEVYATAEMPGYTHMQRATPSTAGLWAAGFAEVVAADLRLILNARDAVNTSPAGSAAGYGAPHIDYPRAEVAAALGFGRMHHNVTSVQLSRGKLEAEIVHSLVQLSSTINRMASDIILFTSTEFGFASLPEEYTTGSSIMPQKKNPDVFEIARATHHILVSELMMLLGLPANLPSGYHRDLQFTKRAVVGSVLRAKELVAAVARVVSAVRFDVDRMKQACTPELFATAAAMRRVIQGTPFREAYREAANDPASWELEASVPLSEQYSSSGLPGRPDVDTVRLELAAIRSALVPR